MKLYYCSHCQWYQRRADFIAEWRVTFDLIDKMVTWASEPKYDENDGAVLLSSPKCECNSEMTIVELDVCPHDWETSGNERRCRLCKQVEKGEVVFK